MFKAFNLLKQSKKKNFEKFGKMLKNKEIFEKI